MHRQKKKVASYSVHAKEEKKRCFSTRKKQKLSQSKYCKATKKNKTNTKKLFYANKEITRRTDKACARKDKKIQKLQNPPHYLFKSKPSRKKERKKPTQKKIRKLPKQQHLTDSSLSSPRAPHAPLGRPACPRAVVSPVRPSSAQATRGRPILVSRCPSPPPPPVEAATPSSGTCPLSM